MKQASKCGRRQALARICALPAAACLRPVAASASQMEARTQNASNEGIGRLTLETSDKDLAAAFEWARRQALAYAFSGDPVGDWYEAALPGRQAFCMRDAAHQAMGAHALGLARHTRNMLRRFAGNISESRDWCSYWEIDRWNRPSPADYADDSNFWYCLPANYDILDCCYRMYVWTADSTYTGDQAFLNFYARTVTDYEERWNLDIANIMTRQRWINGRTDFDPTKNFQFYRGNPGYQEAREPFVLGIDLLATQYAGYLAYAAIQDFQGNREGSRRYRQRAAAVKALINQSWWNEAGQCFYAQLDRNHHLTGRAGPELLYRDVIDEGSKLRRGVSDLLDRINRNPSASVEEQSHHAEILYRYGQPDAAHAQMLDLARPGRSRREYPEVSFSFIGAIVTGLMGISVRPTPPSQASAEETFVDAVVLTLAGLGAIPWAEMRQLPVRRNEIGVRHEGGRRTVFTNQKGPSMIWQPAFAGKFDTLLVDGKPTPARTGTLPPGREVSWLTAPVGAGGSLAVEAPY